MRILIHLEAPRRCQELLGASTSSISFQIRHWLFLIVSSLWNEFVVYSWHETTTKKYTAGALALADLILSFASLAK